MTTSKPTRSAISSASFTIAKDQTQVNEKIRAKELRLIGQDGEQIGVKTKNKQKERVYNIPALLYT
jgi:hypothetical protein